MPFDQVRERQEDRGHQMPRSRLYPPGGTGKKIEGPAEVIIAPACPAAELSIRIANMADDRRDCLALWIHHKERDAYGRKSERVSERDTGASDKTERLSESHVVLHGGCHDHFDRRSLAALVRARNNRRVKPLSVQDNKTLGCCHIQVSYGFFWKGYL